jgi:uncharacterized protein (DUF1800 family)
MALAQTLSSTDTEIAAAWVLRRVGFGATAQDLSRAADIGLTAFLDELFEPDLKGVPDDGDPFSNLDLAIRVGSPQDVATGVFAWFDRMTTHNRPVTEWLAWFWHGHLVSSLSIVKSPAGMAKQISMLRDLGGGSMRPLLRAITIDPAMLRYLDGNRNTGRAPNENYSRELLELFALGVGNYTEADVLAGAKALSGWIQRRNAPLDVQFIARRHDDTPQNYLGAGGVHDLDSVIDAVVAHPACPHFITQSLGAAVLGPTAISGLGSSIAETFKADDMRVRSLVRSLVELGIDGASEPIALSPIPWIVGAIRSTGARIPRRQLGKLVRSAGQVPMNPPNVSGWPTGDAWFSTSSTAARLEAARLIADATQLGSAPLEAADKVDLEALARSLGRPEGFSSSTANALLATETTGKTLLALALSTPEMVIT